MIYVGTSGYNYPNGGAPSSGRLAGKEDVRVLRRPLPAVEINATFYRMPTQKLTTGWLEQAPAGFPRPEGTRRSPTSNDSGLRRSVAFLCDSARSAGAHRGRCCFQLPPNFRADVARLVEFLRGARRRQAGVRVPPRVLADRRRMRLCATTVPALCIADFGDKTTPIQATAAHGIWLRDEEGCRHPERWAIDRHPFGRLADAVIFFKHEERGKG